MLAKSYARIAWQNLANFGILPLEFINEYDYDCIEQGDDIELKDVIQSVKSKENIKVVIHKSKGNSKTIEMKHTLSDRQIQVIVKGGIINDYKEKL